ncbi:ATP-binding cassette subfamily B protein/ATP-binding cassette subfamily C protein [Spinactinospora alkalitolerans]|uniref:ATP-binding cassette subfamily B protein/ATP-binding cassette subfamily C protein n=1 Tax=Spinactinospora alkalitolerans TaxID=687207 RepID=A0A852TZN2_9ACTN|nr:ABC transporter ATP-binding protein [Spinactinospora alkalitolerans]NYE50036.1 ATP-binding cassette subfamily B protein/ATP-binding cassette subfamily C protein [Spinactinospora alkalitolerans]
MRIGGKQKPKRRMEEPGAATGLVLPPLAEFKWQRHAGAATRAGWAGVGRRLPSLVARAFRLAWRADRLDTVVCLVLNVAAGIATATALVATAGVLERLLAAGPTPERVWAALPALAWLAGAALLRGVLSAGAGWAQARLEPKVARVAEIELLELTTRVELRAFDDEGFHDGLHRAYMRGVDEAQRVMSLSVDMLTGLISLAAACGVLGVLHPVLIPLLILAVLPEAWAASAAARIRYVWLLALITGDRRKRMLDWIMTDRSTSAEIRSYTMRRPLLAEYAHLSAHIVDTQMGVARKQAWVRLGGDAAAGAAIVGVFTALGALLATGAMELAVAGAAVVAIRTGQNAISNLLASANRTYESGLYFDDYLSFLDRARARLPAPAAAPAPADFTEITVDRATFCYPGQDTAALTEVSLRIRKGQVIALVGENGSGKTTLSKLLAGLYTPTSGTVCWDGTDLAEVDTEGLRHHIGVIAQEHSHWPLTARRNVTMSSPDDPTRLEGAARVADAHAVVDNLDHGWDTLLDKRYEGGVDLSGGQWQRLAAARGFYRDAPLLICDEPTAALDARAEHKLFTAIHDHARATGSAVVLITHRLASVAMADHIHVLDAGRIIEHGTHDQLMAAQGLYAELYTIQASAYQRPEAETVHD